MRKVELSPSVTDHFRGSSPTMLATTDEIIEALEAKAGPDTVATDLDLIPGNLLIFDNRRWLHGRGKATPISSESGEGELVATRNPL